MRVQIKKLHPSAIIPSYAKNGDAGMDLTAVSRCLDEDGNIVYGTGLAFEIPQGFVGLLFPRSSNSKQDLSLSNSVGVLDSGYRGEVMFKFKPILTKLDETGHSEYIVRQKDVEQYGAGDRVGQIIIIPYPEIEFEEVAELSTTERGSGGYGSTGR